MERVKRVEALDGFRLEVEFDDGIKGIVQMESRLFGPVFEPLKQPNLFKKVFVDEFGAVCWPGGADLAPDALYEKILEATKAA
jgi:hypothetical protein